MTFGEVLAQMLKERGLTMTALSKKSGVPLPTISGLVNGHVKDPTLSNAKKIADALEVKLQDFVDQMELE